VARLFGDPLLASAGLNRLTHQAHVVVITGFSFRVHWSFPAAIPAGGPAWQKTSEPMTSENDMVAESVFPASLLDQKCSFTC